MGITSERYDLIFFSALFSCIGHVAQFTRPPVFASEERAVITSLLNLPYTSFLLAGLLNLCRWSGTFVRSAQVLLPATLLSSAHCTLDSWRKVCVGMIELSTQDSIALPSSVCGANNPGLNSLHVCSLPRLRNSFFELGRMHGPQATEYTRQSSLITSSVVRASSTRSITILFPLVFGRLSMAWLALVPTEVS